MSSTDNRYNKVAIQYPVIRVSLIAMLSNLYLGQKHPVSFRGGEG